MTDIFEQIQRQIHEIRNIVGPVNLKLAEMEHQIIAHKNLIEEKTSVLESKVLNALFRLDKQDIKIADILERLKRLERRAPD